MNASLSLLFLAALPQVSPPTSPADEKPFDTQPGKQTYLYDLKTEGDVTGKATGDIDGEIKHAGQIKDGKLVGDTVTFVEMFGDLGQRTHHHLLRQTGGRRD